MRITPEQYARVLYELTANKTPGQTKALVAAFAAALKRGRDLKKLDTIVRHFFLLSERAQGVRTARVTTAYELEKETEKLLAGFLEKQTGAAVKLEKTIDATILGGAVIRLGDQVIDLSLRNRITQLKNFIVK